MGTVTDINLPEFIESHDWAKKLFLTHTNESKYFLNSDATLALSHMFSVGLKTFKSSPSTIDLIHRNILNYISDENIKIKIFIYFLQHFNDITLDTQNEIDQLNLIQYYHQIIDEIIAPKHLDACNYDCLAAITKFNAFIIEDKLPKIFKKILLSKKVTHEEKTSYVALLSEILDACSRLRRETKLIPWILMAIDKKSKKNKSCLNIDDILPDLFLNKFSNTVSNMTNAQIIKLLMSFTYHLEMINTQSSAENASLITIQIASKLIIAFFDGVHVFDNTLNMQEKFVNGLSKFGNVLEKLISLTFTINDSDILTVSILKIINSWDSVIALVKTYAPNAFTENSMSSILQSVENIHKIIDSKQLNYCTNPNLVQLFVCCKFAERKIHDQPPLILNDLEILQNIENYWEMVFDKYPHLLLYFNDSQIELLASFLMNHSQFDENNILNSTKITHTVVQNNEKLVNELIFLTLSNIYTKLNDSTCITKKLLKIITKKKWESKRMEKIFTSCKELLSNEIQWEEMENESISLIIKYLHVLLALPLIYISIELRTLIFLIIFAISKESEKSIEVTNLCFQILSDISENGHIDILQYIQPEHLISELSKYPSLIKLLEYSLRNVSNYERVKTFIKNNKSIESCAAPVLIYCIDKIKPRLKANEKRIARKFEKKLSVRVLKTLEGGVKTSYDVKCLTAAAKVAFLSKKVDDSLLEKINSTLDKIFGINSDKLRIKDNSKDASPLVEEGLKLVKLIILHQSHIPIDKKIAKCIWNLMLKNMSEDIVKNLFSITGPQLLKKILTQLQKKIVSALDKKDVSLLKNSLQIWCSVVHASMGIRSNTIRHGYLQAFLRYFYTSTIFSEHHLTILKICELSISAKQSQLPEKTIDLIIFTVNNFINNPDKLTIDLCEGILEICLAFGRYRANIITDRLPALLYIYRRILKFVINEARENPSYKQRELECLFLNAQKLATIFVKLKKDITRISPYTVADLIQVYSEGVIPVYMKEPLNNCISMLFSICDQHAVSLLLRTLPVALQEIFKNLFSTYNKFYKFTGKI